MREGTSRPLKVVVPKHAGSTTSQTDREGGRKARESVNKGASVGRMRNDGREYDYLR